jgi:hypothetical protein
MTGRTNLPDDRQDRSTYNFVMFYYFAKANAFILAYKYFAVTPFSIQPHGGGMPACLARVLHNSIMD